MSTKQYAKRDAAFGDWHDNQSLSLNASKAVLRAAFIAGWAARKAAVDYSICEAVGIPDLLVENQTQAIAYDLLRELYDRATFDDYHGESRVLAKVAEDFPEFDEPDEGEKT